MLYNGEDVLVAEADTNPNFTGLADLASLQVRPAGGADCQVELFVGLT